MQPGGLFSWVLACGLIRAGCGQTQFQFAGMNGVQAEAFSEEAGAFANQGGKHAEIRVEYMAACAVALAGIPALAEDYIDPQLPKYRPINKLEAS